LFYESVPLAFRKGTFVDTRVEGIPEREDLAEPEMTQEPDESNPALNDEENQWRFVKW
jgi:hypothetical protein